MSGLPRDLLKWMQSLDLSYSVRNVRRDFCNGFLVAEMISRYFPQEVQMHAFENGTSLKKRLENWELLEKFFKKHKWVVQRQYIDRVIHCEIDAAVPLIQLIYTLLTKREVKVLPTENDEYVPPFARPTASKLVKDRLRDADVLVSKDAQYNARASAQVVDDHSEVLKQERTAEPERFQPQRAPPLQTMRVSQRTLGVKDEMQAIPVKFKKVQVRQIDDMSVSKLRQAHSQSQIMNGANSANGTARSVAPSAAGSASASQASSHSQLQQGSVLERSRKPSLDILSESVLRLFKGSEFRNELKSHQDAVTGFVQNISAFPPELAVDVLNRLAHFISSTEEVVVNCLESPKEFWLVFGTFWTVVKAAPASSAVFAAAVEALATLGQSMRNQDNTTPALLMADFGFPKVVEQIKSSPTKTPSLARLLLAFSQGTADDHVKVIRQLRAGLGFAELMTCMSNLIELDQEFSTESLDIYLYYIVAGMSNVNPRSRHRSPLFSMDSGAR